MHYNACMCTIYFIYMYHRELMSQFHWCGRVCPRAHNLQLTLAQRVELQRVALTVVWVVEPKNDGCTEHCTALLHVCMHLVALTSEGAGN